MAIDMNEVFRRGDIGLIDLLEHCVLAVAVEPLFLFLVHEYRCHPTAAGATALYELFCAPGAPARLPRPTLLPPFELRLPKRIGALAPTPVEGIPPEAWPPVLPARYLFDDLARALSDGQARAVAAAFDPALGPRGSLPGGAPTEQGRRFLQKVWQPVVRPRLVAAGFRRVGNVGG